jgi:hypothetical protein
MTTFLCTDSYWQMQHSGSRCVLAANTRTIVDWSANAEAKIRNQNLIAQAAWNIWLCNVHVIFLFATDGSERIVRKLCMNRVRYAGGRNVSPHLAAAVSTLPMNASSIGGIVSGQSAAG